MIPAVKNPRTKPQPSRFKEPKILTVKKQPWPPVEKPAIIKPPTLILSEHTETFSQSSLLSKFKESINDRRRLSPEVIKTSLEVYR